MSKEDWQQMCDAYQIMLDISMKYGLDLEHLKNEAVYLLLIKPMEV